MYEVLGSNSTFSDVVDSKVSDFLATLRIKSISDDFNFDISNLPSNEFLPKGQHHGKCGSNFSISSGNPCSAQELPIMLIPWVGNSHALIDLFSSNTKFCGYMVLCRTEKLCYIYLYSHFFLVFQTLQSVHV